VSLASSLQSLGRVAILWCSLDARLNSSRSERPPSTQATWLRFLLPAVSDLLFVILLASLSIGALAPRLLGDAGIGWHIRNGEAMLQTHSVTRTDAFSSSVSGQPWYAWEWLYDVAISAVHHLAGLNGVVYVTALVITLSFVLLFRLMFTRGTDLVLAVVLVVLAIGASAIHLFARPHVVSWLLTLIWFSLLDRAEESGNVRPLYWLPLITVVWANLHGGFVLGLVLLGLYLVAAAMRFRLQPAWLRSLSRIAALCFLASVVNPYGYKLHLHVYEYLTNRFLMNHIDEFSSPNFHGIGQQCFLALLLLSIAAMAMRRQELRASHLLVLLFAAYSGLYASRNLPVSSILLVLITGPVLSRAFAEAPKLIARIHAFSLRMGDVERRSRGQLWPAVAVVLGVLVCTGHAGPSMHAHFDGKRFPVRAGDALEHAGLPPTIFSPDYWGGYLIYRFYPRMKVVVDDRHDLYGEAFLRKYLATIHFIPGWNKLLDEKNVQWALLPEGSSLANGLKEAGWTIHYEDDTAVLLKKPE
jgi:hypothetical protein